jgi:2-succinyl-5-enolpyruvyl-6-hydroxy-3-cyclohexene-1-carboxylate synthase
MHCNRGANGIDGTLSTAMGLAHGGPPTVLVTGDLAFLHDSNGLLARPLLRGRLTVVLINNQGGGIFEHLPVARLEPPFESHFATAQEVDFAQLCAAHGVAHRLLADARELPPALHEATDPGITVLELKTDRKKDRDTLRQLLRAL